MFDTSDLSTGVIAVYSVAELSTVRLVATIIDRDISGEQVGNSLAEIQQRASQIASELTAQSNRQILLALQEAYDRGDSAAIASLQGQVDRTFVNSRALTALVRDTNARLNSTHFAIVRQASDVYSRVISSVSGPTVVGLDTRRQAAQQALNQFARVGVRGFVDRSGRNWGLTSYAEMATRTTTMRAAIHGHTDRLVTNGYELGIISAHSGSCDLCDPWEGVIVSQSGASKDYPSLADAMDDGLFHPNCEHSIGAYIDGATRPMEVMGTEQNRELYQATQQQRYNERQIRSWRMREAAAITPESRVFAENKISQWQSRQAEHVSQWSLRRKPERELLGVAR